MSTDNRKPPRVPEDYPQQRYFLPGTGSRGLYITEKLFAPAQEVRLLRDARADCVELSIRASHFGEMNVHLDAKELRSIAAALLDAAHDIETNPAASLRQTSAHTLLSLLVDPSDGQPCPDVRS